MVSYGVKWCHMVSSAKGPRWVSNATNAEGGRCATAVAIISMFEAILFEHSTVMAGSGVFTIGADGFELGRLARCVRKDLKTMLAPTYWQMHRTHERALFFQCTKVPNGTADLLLTTLTQHVVGHTERRGYVLDNSYVTMTPACFGSMADSLITLCTPWHRENP